MRNTFSLIAMVLVYTSCQQVQEYASPTTQSCTETQDGVDIALSAGTPERSECLSLSIEHFLTGIIQTRVPCQMSEDQSTAFDVKFTAELSGIAYTNQGSGRSVMVITCSLPEQQFVIRPISYAVSATLTTYLEGIELRSWFSGRLNKDGQLIITSNDLNGVANEANLEYRLVDGTLLIELSDIREGPVNARVTSFGMYCN